MKKPFIYGATSHEERSVILHHFRQGHPSFRTIFLSKVGDTSLDLPEATCLIQISSQFGSRRQEAQRMGRILRAKRRFEVGFRSRFYTLVAKDTDEVQFSAKRRRFLVDQGYEFKVIPDYKALIPTDEYTQLHYTTAKEEYELLQLVKQQSDETGLDEVIEAAIDDVAGEWQNQSKKQSTQSKDTKKGKAVAPVKEKKRHSLFKKWAAK
jgi:DNA excision repair protein ERCC-3